MRKVKTFETLYVATARKKNQIVLKKFCKIHIFLPKIHYNRLLSIIICYNGLKNLKILRL